MPTNFHFLRNLMTKNNKKNCKMKINKANNNKNLKNQQNSKWNRPIK